jgi:hypothetical protein
MRLLHHAFQYICARNAGCATACQPSAHVARAASEVEDVQTRYFLGQKAGERVFFERLVQARVGLTQVVIAYEEFRGVIDVLRQVSSPNIGLLCTAAYPFMSPVARMSVSCTSSSWSIERSGAASPFSARTNAAKLAT